MSEQSTDLENSTDIGARDATDSMDTSWEGRLRERDPALSYASDSASECPPSPQRKLDAFGFVKTQRAPARKDSSACHHTEASKATVAPAMSASKMAQRPTPSQQEPRIKTEPASTTTQASVPPAPVIAAAASVNNLPRTLSATRLLANLDTAVRPFVEPRVWPIPRLDPDGEYRRPTQGEIDGVASRSQHDLRIPAHELVHRSIYVPRTREQRIEAKEAREWMLCLMASLEPNFPIVDLELGTAQLYQVSDDDDNESYSPGSWVPYDADIPFDPKTIEHFLRRSFNTALHRKLNAVGVHTPEDLLTIACVVLPDSSAIVQFRLGLELELRSQWKRLKRALKAFARMAGPDI
ncbi:hypothetical protein CYLTODRAFT_459410 [Cylindrobasidium torrendii FP15055 ss-10]|uniref:Uncharacterized protein n=1 Tax=Cylindrobasidium torrendii FP15055 ss-10 TaxID=1314674 RepID=A0A0D7AVC6_9AGAR|nr:hypothetical protein CYLTODRAFT_459410 [Cylindrobasidium torrendii FP15055 ss-10]